MLPVVNEFYIASCSLPASLAGRRTLDTEEQKD